MVYYKGSYLEEGSQGTMDWTVYILRCADGTLYTGITNDLERRISEHQSGQGAKYTRGRGPFELVFNEPYRNRAEASRREIEVKSMKRAQKLKLVTDIQFLKYSAKGI